MNFPRKEVCIAFENAKVSLSEVVALLASLGYEPELKLADLEAKRRTIHRRRLWMQIGFAGFAFGNIMLLQHLLLPGVGRFNGPIFNGCSDI